MVTFSSLLIGDERKPGAAAPSRAFHVLALPPSLRSTPRFFLADAVMSAFADPCV